MVLILKIRILRKTMQKVFVVDDEEQIADAISAVLRDAQFDVETFYAARSALIRANECPPDVLVSDIVMPKMDGVALAQAFREMHPKCRVILISGNPYWTLRGKSQRDELNNFTVLSKPFPIRQLLRLIKSSKG